MTEKFKEKCNAMCEHISVLTGVNCMLFESNNAPELECLFYGQKEMFCEHCECERCNKNFTLAYGMNEANRWQGKYVSYCPLGFVFVSASLYNNAGMIAGPIIIGEPKDTFVDFPYPVMLDELEKLPVMSTKEVQHLAELMKGVVRSCHAESETEDATEFNQQDYLNALYEAKDKYALGKVEGETIDAYPINDERKLLAAIREGDKAGAQEMLNKLLGEIYFYSDFKLDLIKARMIELVTLLSREAIASGANISDMFSNNTNYIREIEKAVSIDEISTWLAGIMHSFIHIVFDYSGVKHSDIVFKVSSYVKENYNQKMTLDEIAKEVGMSSAYLSSVFKREMGISISNFINKTRVEHSKKMLKNTSMTLSFIASECCFETPSYFTKVFKDFVGVTPRQYRNMEKY